MATAMYRAKEEVIILVLTTDEADSIAAGRPLATVIEPIEKLMRGNCACGCAEKEGF